MSKLVLYTTLGCHLCERLEAELADLGITEPRLERIEIAEDEALLARYGTRIPVLVDVQGEELEGGIETEQLVAWLDAREISTKPRAQDEPPRTTERTGVRRVRGRRFLA